MTSADIRALIEEARTGQDMPWALSPDHIITRLADALEAEASARQELERQAEIQIDDFHVELIQAQRARQELADKIEALAERWTHMKDNFDPNRRLTPESAAHWRARGNTFDQCATELRGLLSGDNKAGESSNG